MQMQIASEVTMASGGVITLFDDRWSRVAKRDRSADGQFYYSVETTGVYCRPSCPARLAKPENVRFHQSCADAERAGFRPCKRCRPGQPSVAELHAGKVEQACRLIETEGAALNLGELAARVGMTAFHFHRVFKSVTGLTPKRYAMAHRSASVRQKLSEGSETITDMIYSSGYNSNGSFYQNSDRLLGMTPSAYREGGGSMEVRFAVGQCSLGSVLVAQSDLGVCAILMGDAPEGLVHQLENRFRRAKLVPGNADFETTVARVVGFIDHPAVGLDLPLDIRGTVFQQRVWEALTRIPPGSTVSYSQLAALLGMPKAARAVAQACGSNALAVAIPCHRVVRNDGDLAGYRWGIERKRALLEREASS